MKNAVVWVDEGLPIAADRLAGRVELRRFEGRALTPEADGLEAAAALLIRSTARVDEELLRAAPSLRVVASATIGLDHVDLRAAARHGVSVSGVPGCNAPGVADWVVSALLDDALERELPLVGRKLGVIGVGQTGGRVAARARALGMRVLLRDPPRAELDSSFHGATLEDVLTTDVLTIHVPLTSAETSAWPTARLIDADRLARLPLGSLLINAARGGLVDEAALRRALADDKQGPARAALDTWEDEPRPNPHTVHAAWRATPHAAGATYEGKWRAQTGAVAFVLDALGLPLAPESPCRRPERHPAPLVVVREGDHERSAVRLAAAIAGAVLDLPALDRRFRDAVARGEAFDGVRAAHRRHELGAVVISLEGNVTARDRQVVAGAGFTGDFSSSSDNTHLRVIVR